MPPLFFKGKTVGTQIVVQCILCPKSAMLAKHDMSDEAAVKLAVSHGWTVKPTVCPECNALPRAEYRKRMRAWKKRNRQYKICPTCRGNGNVHVTPRSFGTCQSCHGEGEVPRSFRERVKSVMGV